MTLGFVGRFFAGPVTKEAERIMSLLERPKDTGRATIERLNVRVRWYHILVVVSAFLICFYLVTLLTLVFIPLDVTFYGEPQTQFSGETPQGGGLVAVKQQRAKI